MSVGCLNKKNQTKETGQCVISLQKSLNIFFIILKFLVFMLFQEF